MGDNEDVDSMWSDSDNSSNSRAFGGLFDPLHFSTLLVTILFTFVVYLLLPRGIRKQYCGAYPKRHAWSARSRQQQQQRGVRQYMTFLLCVVVVIVFHASCFAAYRIHMMLTDADLFIAHARSRPWKAVVRTTVVVA
jgi:ABC-type Fe3+ transport system permease subunit